MSDSYQWRLELSGRDFPAGCVAAFQGAGSGATLTAEELRDFPVLLSDEDSFQHLLSVGDWVFEDQGGGDFRLSFTMAGLHESTTWPMESLFLPWLCQFAASDQFVCTIAREPERLYRSLTYAVGGSAVTVSANGAEAPDASGIALDALREAVNGNLVDGEGMLDQDGKPYKVRAVRWSLIEDSFS